MTNLIENIPQGFGMYERTPMVGDVVMGAAPAFESLERFYQETPSALDMWTAGNKFWQMQGSTEYLARGFESLSGARINLLRGVTYLAGSGSIDYLELLDPRMASWAATVGLASKISGGVEYSKDIALSDYFAGLQLQAVGQLLGYSYGHRIFDYIPSEDTSLFSEYLAKLSEITPRFEASVQRLADLSLEHLGHITNYDLLLEEVVFKLEQERAKLPSPQRDKAVQGLIDKFCDIRDEALGTVTRGVLGPIVSVAEGLEDSQVSAYLTGQNHQDYETLAPSFIKLGQDITDDQIGEVLVDFRQVLEATPRLQTLLTGLLAACLKDSIKIGEIINLRPGETEVDYLNRLKPYLDIELTDEQQELIDFVREQRSESEEVDEETYLNEYPVVLLRKISEICGVNLQHATSGTPHMADREKILSALSDKLEEQGQLMSVGTGLTNDQVLRRRVLIQEEGSSYFSEWNIITGEEKGMVDTRTKQGCVLVYEPINILDHEQYRTFVSLMEAMLLRI